ncbi:MAG: PAS domain S-box-containing protein [Motiliproteus sp.]|jgi:PAS domain S-box-containing protein
MRSLQPAPMNKRSRSLAQTLFSTQALLLLFTLAVIGPMIYLVLLYDLQGRAKQSNQLLARAVSAQVAEFTNTPTLLLKGLGVADFKEGYESLPLLRQYMDRLIDQTQTFEAIYFLAPDNRVEAVGLPEGRRRFRSDYEDVYLSTQAFVDKTRATQRPQWSDIFVSVLSSTSLGVAVPFAANHVVVGHFSIEKLSRFVQTLALGSDTLAFIVDGNGQIIVFPDTSLAQQQLNISNLPLISSALQGEETTGNFVLFDRDFLASSFKIPGMDWVVVVAQSRDSIARGLEKTLWVVLIGICAALGVALLISRWFAVKLAGPFVLLTEASEQLQQGNFDLAMPDSSVREIQSMSHSFERMAKELQTQQRSLQASKRKYRALVSRVPCALYQIESGIRGRVAFISPPILSLTGYRPADFAEGGSIDLDDLIHPDDRFERSRTIDECCANQRPWALEYRLLHADGSVRWVYEEGSESADKQTQRVFRDAMMIDNTQRRQAEIGLLEQIELMTTLLHTVPSPIYYKNKNGEYLGCNRAFERFFEVSPRDLIGSHAEAGERLPRCLQTLAEGETQLLGQVTAETHDLHLQVRSQTRCITLKRASFADMEGRVAGMVGVIYDLTGRVEAERESQRLRRYMGNVIDSMPSVLFCISRQLELVQVNPEGVKKMQATGVDNPGYQAVLAQYGLAADWLKAAITGGQTVTLRRQLSADSSRHADVTLYPLDTSVGGGAVLRIDDVTERVSMEELLVQSEKILSVGGLAAGMAHEINNPLAGILQNTQVLKNRLDPGLAANQRVAQRWDLNLDAVRHYLEERAILQMLDAIQESGQRAARIVENMLSFARTGDSALLPEDLEGLLERTIELAFNDYGLKKSDDFLNIELVRKFEPLVPVRCEPSKLQQVFFNLLKNSAQAMRDAQSPHPQITLSLKSLQGCARIEVADTGPGIPPEVLKRVFEPFFTTKEVGVGTGLGLSVSYFIITENHDGKLWVESDVGQGATFIIELPLAS